MNKKELENEIAKTQKQLEALQKKLKEAENEVPETLDINDDDEYSYVDETGNINWTSYTHLSEFDVGLVHNHRAFLEERLAEMFADKTQFMADLLYFKALYDKDYMPNWGSGTERKYCIYYNGKTNKFEWSYVTGYCRSIESVYFSTEKIAQKCVDWLDKFRRTGK